MASTYMSMPAIKAKRLWCTLALMSVIIGMSLHSSNFVQTLTNTRSASKDRATKANPDQATRTRVVEAYGKLPLSFEANQGQTDGRVKVLSRGHGYDLFLTSTEAVLTLNKGQEFGARDPESEKAKPARKARNPKLEIPLRMK